MLALICLMLFLMVPAGALAEAGGSKKTRKASRKAAAAAAKKGQEWHVNSGSDQRFFRVGSANETDGKSQERGGAGKPGVRQALDKPEQGGRRVTDDGDGPGEVFSPAVDRRGRARR